MRAPLVLAILSLLYGTKVWNWGGQILDLLEVIQNYFMRKILVLPKGSPRALNRAEHGIPYLKARASIRALSYWKKNIEQPQDSQGH